MIMLPNVGSGPVAGRLPSSGLGRVPLYLQALGKQINVDLLSIIHSWLKSGDAEKADSYNLHIIIYMLYI